MPAVAAICRLDERPDLIDRVYEVDSAWPEFMTKDPVANALYWQVAGAFPHLCAVAVDDRGGVAATARALAFALDIDGRRELPDGGLDRVTIWAFNDRLDGQAPDTGSAVEIAVGRAHRGTGLSYRMLAALREAAQAAGLARLVAPVRPTGKHRYPVMPMAGYVAIRRDDGLPADPWLRVHIRAGGRILRVAPASMVARLHLVPVYYESGARPHPPQSMYRAYLAQSQVFVGVYWQRYGWVGPGMEISGLEDEFRLAVAAGMPMLVYLKRPAPDLEPGLAAMIDAIRQAGSTSYRTFGTPRELERLLADDLALLLSESFAGAAAALGRAGTPAGAELPAGTLTFLLTDIEGSTRLWESAPEAMGLALERHDRLLAEVIEAHGGTVIGSRGEGDSLFAVFPGAVAAVEAAGTAQLGLAAEDWPAGAALRVRMGLHTGQARAPGSDRVDHGPVNRCARVRAAAHGGQVLVTQATHDLAGGRLGGGFGLARLGEFRLRDLAEPEVLFQLTHPGLPADFPPPVTPAERAGNLPLQATAFVGRTREKSEVEALVASCRLVTLTGAGGCGKTRLSLEVAASLRDGYGDGAWLAELAAVSDDSMVAPAISRALGVAGPPGRPVLEALLEALAPQEMLVVLDNCEQVIGGCAKVADVIVRHCPKVRLVATSREPLGIGAEAIYRVPPLSLPGPGDDPAAAQSSDAVALFADRAARQGVSLVLDEQTIPLVASICRRLDGLPLAIELAAARLRSLSLTDLAARVDQRFRLLTGGSRTAPARQQTLRAAIDWSYSLLAEAERVLLRRLAVFPAGFDLAAAEAVCGFADLDVFDVTDLLGSLVDKSLVVAEPAADGTLRYRLLETIRQFAAEKLTEAAGVATAALPRPAEAGELEDTRRRHAEHYAALAERARDQLVGPAQSATLDRLEADYDNLRAALTWSLGSSAADPAPDGERAVPGLRLAQALGQFWVIRGHSGEGRRWLQRAVDLAADDAGAPLASLAHWLGRLLIQQGEHDAAVRLFERSLAIWRELGDRDQQAMELNSLGGARRRQGELDAARSALNECIAICREVGNEELLGTALTNLGQTELYAHDFDLASKRLQEALALNRQHEDSMGAAVDLISLAYIGLLNGRAREARGLLSGTLGYLASSGDSEATADVLELGACIAAELGEAPRAARLAGAAGALRELVGMPISPEDAEAVERYLSQVRTATAPEEWEAELAAGRALTQEQAVTLLARALGDQNEA